MILGMAIASFLLLIFFGFVCSLNLVLFMKFRCNTSQTNGSSVWRTKGFFTWFNKHSLSSSALVVFQTENHHFR